MYFHSDSVTQRMSEEISITRFINNIPSITVQLTAGYTGFNFFQSFQLCFKYYIINLSHFLRRLSHADCSCHIAVVPIIDCTEIHKYKITVFHLIISRYPMRHRRICSGKSNCLKRQSLSSVFKHAIVQFQSNFTLCNSRTNKSKYFIECFFSNFLCFVNFFNFLSRFNSPHIINIIAEFIGFYEFNIRKFFFKKTHSAKCHIH